MEHGVHGQDLVIAQSLAALVQKLELEVVTIPLKMLLEATVVEVGLILKSV